MSRQTKYSIILLLAVLLLNEMIIAQSPHVVVLTSGTKTSIRGLSVVTDNVVWVSGSNGTFGRTTDGGKTWEKIL